MTPRGLRYDVAGIFRRLRNGLGGRPLAYLWTAEWHKTDHGLHVHFVVGEYIGRSLIDRVSGHEFARAPALHGRLADRREASRKIADHGS